MSENPPTDQWIVDPDEPSDVVGPNGERVMCEAPSLLITHHAALAAHVAYALNAAHAENPPLRDPTLPDPTIISFRGLATDQRPGLWERWRRQRKTL